MSAVFAFFIKNYKFSFLMTFILILSGLMGLVLLQRESFPPVNFASVSVVTIYPGASPEEVQDQVTKIIEDELRGTAGLKDVKSTSQSGRSQINIRIDIDRNDSREIINEIQRAVTRASSKLPPEITEAPLVTEIKAKEIPVLELALEGQNEARQRDRMAENLKERLEDVKGVSSVRLSGYQEREIQILVDRKKLADYSLGLSEVVQKISTRLKNIPAGFLEDQDKLTSVRLIAKTSNIEEIKMIVLRTNDSGNSIRIKDIAQVVDTAENAQILVRHNGVPATLLVVTKKEDYDAISVVDEALRAVENFKKNLSSDQRIIIYNDEADRIKDRLDIVQWNAIAGLLAVLFILFFFLPGKIGLMSSMSLPICALGTIASMVYLDANFNIITMIALVICLGNLVDNSVVVSENYTSLREKGADAQTAALESARQFWIPFTASTVTIVAAFLPMLVTEGVLGQFIRWIPIVVSLALVISLIESLTLLPARLQFLSAKKRNESEGSQNSFFSRAEDSFAKIVSKVIRLRWLALALLTGVVFSGFITTALFNRFELFPADGVEYYVIRFEAPAQTRLIRTDAAAAELSNSVFAALGTDIVESIISRSGVQQVDVADPQSKNGENVGFLLIKIHKSKYLNLPIEATLEKLRSLPFPKLFTEVQVESLAGGPPIGKPVTVNFRSSDKKILFDEAHEFVAELKKIEGVFNVKTDQYDTGNEYLFLPNDLKTAYVGLSADQIGLNLRAALEGIEVSKLTDRGREFNVRVRYTSDDKQSIGDLQQTGLLNSRGSLTPLHILGSLNPAAAPPIIKNYDFRRSITVTADVKPEIITSSEANEKARAILKNTLAQSSEVSTIFGGEDESTNESLRSLGIALLLSVMGIFATLVFVFKSFSKPLLILSTIPLGLVGVFYSFAINQRPLSFLAFIGVIGLTGVVINSAIILVDYIEELRKESPNFTLTEILVLASRRRLRAVLATGLTTVVGLLPTAFGWGGDDPLLIPITLALSWGMIVGTVLSLVWIPVCYVLLEEGRTKFHQTWTRFI